MRFREFKTCIMEDMPSVVNSVHAALGGTPTANAAPQTNSVTTGTMPTVPTQAGTMPAVTAKPGQNAPNFVNGSTIKMKNGNQVQNFKVSNVNPATKQITLTNMQAQAGQPTSSTYNMDDITGNIVA